MNEMVLQAFRQFTPREADDWMFRHEGMRGMLERQIMMFPCAVLPKLGRPAAIVGVVHSFGVGTVWMITSDELPRCALPVMRQSRLLCQTIYSVLHLHRLQMFVDSARPDAKRWAEHVGFRFEHGPLVSHGPRGNDEDVYLWRGK